MGETREKHPTPPFRGKCAPKFATSSLPEGSSSHPGAARRHPLSLKQENPLPESQTAPHIGVLAIQGDYERHAAALEESGAQPSLIKTAEALESIDGLILPGGESTTMLKFLDRAGFFDAVKTFAQSKPVFGTCAGAI